MFDWISRIVEAISNSIGSMVSFLGTEIANAVFDAILKWFYEIIYNAVADFFTEMGPATVYFNIGATVLDEKEMHHMDFIAKNLIEKADKETMIYITLCGSADSTTGTMKRNDYLSKARGEYIYNLLTEKYGIDGSRLNVQSKVIAKPSNPALSRAVTISF